MKPQPISLGTQSNPGRALAAGSARLINCYVEQSGQEQKSAVQLHASDGLSSFSSSTASVSTRAMIDVDGTLYQVAGRRIYKVDPSGVKTDIGGIASDAPVTMARNRRDVPQIAVVSQDGIYCVIESNTVTQIYLDTDTPPNSVCFLDGYFCFTHQDGRISHSNSDDALTVDGLANGDAESDPDGAIMGIVKQREWLVFGQKSIEFFGDVGTTPFAFARNQAVDIGCAAAGSVARVEQTVMFVADDFTVRILQGYQAARVSTHAVERDIRSDANRASLVACTWRLNGHTFYCLSGTAFSWVYDLTTQQWHNRESYGRTRWKATCAVESNGQIIVGEDQSNALYVMSPDNYADGSDPLVVKIVTPPAHVYPERLIVSSLYVDILPGVGLVGGATQDVTPQVMLRTSIDGGVNWSDVQTADLGEAGDTTAEVVFRRLGATSRKGMVFEISASAAVMRGFIGAATQPMKLNP